MYPPSGQSSQLSHAIFSPEVDVATASHRAESAAGVGESRSVIVLRQRPSTIGLPRIVISLRQTSKVIAPETATPASISGDTQRRVSRQMGSAVEHVAEKEKSGKRICCGRMEVVLL